MDLYGKCAASFSLCLPQGQTWDNIFYWKSDGVAVDLTGYTARMMLRSSVEAAAPTVSLTTADGSMTVSALGAIALNYSATLSSAVPAGTYLYDMELESSSGVVRRLIEGTAVVSREITR